MTDAKKERIYLDPKLNVLPDYYDRDIVKVLTKNLKEVYIFWGISNHSFEKILHAFQCQKEEIRFKLLVNYKQNDKVPRHNEVYLPPFTNNWILEFEQSIKNLKVEVIAYGDVGKTYSLLHSAEISIPTHKPSTIVHKEWINLTWIQEYNTIEINGEIHIQENEKRPASNYHRENQTEGNFEFNPNLEQSDLEWQERKFVWSDGSSGFMGSSGLFASSSNHLR